MGGKLCIHQVFWLQCVNLWIYIYSSKYKCDTVIMWFMSCVLACIKLRIISVNITRKLDKNIISEKFLFILFNSNIPLGDNGEIKPRAETSRHTCRRSTVSTGKCAWCMKLSFLEAVSSLVLRIGILCAYPLSIIISVDLTWPELFSTLPL